jgi:hypothetical protein
MQYLSLKEMKMKIIEMKKIAMVSVIFFLTIFSAYSQNTFELLVENNYDEIVLDVIELPDGNFILVGTYEDPNQSDIYHGYIIKMNNTGNIISSAYINDYSYCMLHNVHFYNDELYVIATLRENTDTNFVIGLFRFNTDLGLLDVNINSLEGNKQIGFVNSIIDSDSNLVICGISNDYSVTGVNIGSNGYVYKMSITGDSLSSKFFVREANLLKYPTGIIEKVDSTGYNLFIKYYTSTSNCSKINLNKNLQEMSVINLYSEIAEDNYALHSSTHATPIRINDSSILISGRYPLNETFFTFTMSEEDSIISTAYIENENRIQWANTYGNSINGNNIYSGYTSNVSFSDFYFSHDTSHIHIVKFDEELNIIWHKVLGGDAYYNLYRVLACSDGGCLLVANKFEYEDNPDKIRNVYIAKLSIDGDFLWKREYPVSKMISIFPNPVKNNLYLDLSKNVSINEYKIFNQLGDLVLSGQHFSGTINVDALSVGTYIIQLSTNIGIVSEKFTKVK